MKRMFRNFLRETRGVAAIEVALVMPVMFFLYFGLFDITTLVGVNRKVTYAASVVVDLIAQHKTSVLQSDIANYYNASDMVMSPIDLAAVRVEVYGYRISGTTISQVWKTNNAHGSSCGAAPSTGAMAPLMVSENDLVVTRVCTTYTPVITTFLGRTILPDPSIVVSETITERPRSSLLLTCYQTVVNGAVCT